LATHDFPGLSVIASFKLVEGMLEEVLRFVPYCREHENVWSPPLVTILLDTCSQLDSLWKFETEQLPRPIRSSNGNQNIIDHFQNFGERVADRWVVFWSEKGEKLAPFAPWIGLADYNESSYRPLAWWTAYNAVKHDRIANRKEATLKNVAHALAGLYLGILRSRQCAASIAQEGWIPSPVQGACDPCYLLDDDPPVTFLAVECKLLSHLLTKDSLNRKGPKQVTTWASYRFLRWFADNVPDSQRFF